MHARNRTWPLGSDPAERCRQRTMPVEGGDGSTLSLDFTTGVLDPRLQFSRTTNATFINSQGLVQYAGQNLYFNTAFGGLSGTNPSLTSSGWTYAFSTGSATFHGDGSVTMTASSQRIGISRSSGFTGAGRRVIASVDILTVGDTGLTPSNLLITGTYTNGAHYVNSTLYTTGNVIGPCTLSFVFDSPTSGTTGAYFGVGMSGNSTATVKFANPRLNLWNGVVPAPYLENTSTTAERHDPRFDYDPTSIGSPRGLLIEGQVENRVTQSESFSGWTLASAVLGATALGPDGNTSSALTLREDNTTNPHACVLTGRTVTSGSSATFSVFVKAGASPRRYILIRVNDNASNANAASVMWDTQTRTISGAATAYGTFTNVSATRTEYAATSWDRIALTFTPSTATIACKLELSNNGSRSADGQSVAYLGDNSSGVLIWGAQLETGSGASSYIPTGASQGSRSADNCVTAIANLTGFNANQGTIYEAWRDNTASDTSVVQEWAFAFGLTGASGVGIFVSNAASGTFGVNGGISNTGDAGPAGTYVIGGINKAAIAINVAGTSLKLSANGSAVATGTNISGYNTAQTFSLGQRNANIRYLNGWIRQFKYWPYLLPDAQLQALTT